MRADAEANIIGACQHRSVCMQSPGFLTDVRNDGEGRANVGNPVTGWEACPRPRRRLGLSYTSLTTPVIPTDRASARDVGEPVLRLPKEINANDSSLPCRFQANRFAFIPPLRGEKNAAPVGMTKKGR